MTTKMHIGNNVFINYKKQSKLKQHLFLTLLLSWIFIILCLQYDYYDYYVYTSVSLCNIVSNDGFIKENPIKRSGFVESDINLKSNLFIPHTLLAILSFTTSLPCRLVVLTPIAIIIQSLTMYLLFKHIFKIDGLLNNLAKWLSLLFLIIIGITITSGPTNAGPLYYISIGYIYFYLFIYLALKCTFETELNIKSIIIMTTLILVSAKTYYTSIYLITISILAMILFGFIQRVMMIRFSISSKINIAKLSRLLLISIISIFTLTEPIYKLVFVPLRDKNVLQALIEMLWNFYDKSVSMVTSEEGIYGFRPVMTYTELYTMLGKIYLVHLIVLIFISFVVLLAIITRQFDYPISRIVKENYARLTVSIFIYTFIAILQVIAYFTHGQHTYAIAWLAMAITVAGTLILINLVVGSRVRHITLTKYIRIVFIAIIIITMASGFSYRVLGIYDNYYVSFYKYSERSVINFIINHISYETYLTMPLKLHFLIISKYLERQTNIEETPKIVLIGTKLPSTHSYYVEYFSPFEFFGTKGYAHKYDVMKNMLGSHDLFDGIVYQDSRFTIWVLI